MRTTAYLCWSAMLEARAGARRVKRSSGVSSIFIIRRDLGSWWGLWVTTLPTFLWNKSLLLEIIHQTFSHISTYINVFYTILQHTIKLSGGERECCTEAQHILYSKIHFGAALSSRNIAICTNRSTMCSLKLRIA